MSFFTNFNNFYFYIYYFLMQNPINLTHYVRVMHLNLRKSIFFKNKFQKISTILSFKNIFPTFLQFRQFFLASSVWTIMGHCESIFKLLRTSGPLPQFHITLVQIPPPHLYYEVCNTFCLKIPPFSFIVC